MRTHQLYVDIRDISKLTKGAMGSEQLLKKIQAVANKRLSKGMSGCCCGLFKAGRRGAITQAV